jgi:hypoxanthine phosphoribosyltransferase
VGGETEREHLTWQDFGDATRALSRGIVADGFEPEVVVAIARGGLLPAGAIAYGLGVKSCGALNVEFYTGIGEVLDAPEVLPPALDIEFLADKRVLLVDDVADSGRTLVLAVELLRAHGADVRSATIYTKPTSVALPDYSWKQTARWIEFPWSWQGSVIEEDVRKPESDSALPSTAGAA